MESLITIWQAGGGTFGIGVALNTQLMAGALTSTTDSGAACAPEAAPKIPVAAMTATRIVIFTAICLPSRKYCQNMLAIPLKIEFRQISRRRPALPIAF